MSNNRAPFVFDKMLREAAMQGILPRQNKQAVEWFQQKARGVRMTPGDILNRASRAGRSKDTPIRGGMFMFTYDPKLKKELPFYDRFPCIFVVDVKKYGFLGLNLHYLPLQLRAKLMNALYNLKMSQHLTPKTKLALTYNILNQASKYKLFKPCLKMYLYKQIRSRLIEIEAQEWDMAIFLPVQQFQKASEQAVHRWAMQQI